MTPVRSLVAHACLGILLHLDEKVTRDSLTKFPLTEYTAGYWFVHARFEGVSENADEGMKRLFGKRKPQFSIWLWICDPTVPFWRRGKLAERPRPPRGTALHFAAFCGLHEVVSVLVIEHSENVNSRSFEHESTPLHLASKEGRIEVVRFLVEHDADAATKDKHGWTPLHRASSSGDLDLAIIFMTMSVMAAQIRGTFV